VVLSIGALPATSQQIRDLPPAGGTVSRGAGNATAAASVPRFIEEPAHLKRARADGTSPRRGFVVSAVQVTDRPGSSAVILRNRSN